MLFDDQTKAESQEKEQAESKYGSMEEAMRVGSAYYSLKEYAKTREPFEAALKLARTAALAP